MQMTVGRTSHTLVKSRALAAALNPHPGKYSKPGKASKKGMASVTGVTKGSSNHPLQYVA